MYNNLVSDPIAHFALSALASSSARCGIITKVFYFLLGMTTTHDKYSRPAHKRPIKVLNASRRRTYNSGLCGCRCTLLGLCLCPSSILTSVAFFLSHASKLQHVITQRNPKQALAIVSCQKNMYL